mmetsp:Transcript_3129/g.6928  ORF Transcript_3129/g.6928 Transcript_3129/m.6928 type:complete len:99 (+) Transcript_3129:183-479(+)
MLNYATEKEIVAQTPEFKRNFNLMNDTSACIRITRQTIPRWLSREATGKKSTVICKNITLFDACFVAFDNPGCSSSGYYNRIEEICADLGLTQEEFTL